MGALRIETKSVKFSSELDMLKNAVYIYSCYKYISGQESKPLANRMATVLALYMMYGFNEEAKEKAMEVFGAKKATINSLNHQLRDRGYLLMDDRNSNISHLSNSVESLRKLHLHCKEKNRDFEILFKMSLENDSVESID
jgi:hypothetical protein